MGFLLLYHLGNISQNRHRDSKYRLQLKILSCNLWDFCFFLFLSELLAIILTPAKQLAFAKDIKWYKRITSIDGDVETLNNECILN